MTDMTRTLKLINDCDEEDHFERQVKRELLRLVSTIERLETQLYAVGAGGVGPLIPVTVQHQDNPNSDNELQRKTGDSVTSSSVPARQAAGLEPVTLHLTMCADQYCGNYATCYRAQAKPAPDQPFFALSPREGEACRLYAPMRHSNGASALREGQA
ncbi:MAG: hypothetical protein ACRCTG_16745 [Aestuariivirga sp.]